MSADPTFRKWEAWEAYGDLFKAVEQKRKWSRDQLVVALNEDARKKNLPKCTYHKRSTEHWEAQPKDGQPSRKPRSYRVAHVYEFLTEQLTILGEAEKFGPKLKAIAPSIPKFRTSGNLSERNQLVALSTQSAADADSQEDAAALTPTESEELDHGFVALALSGLYDQAATLAQRTLVRTTDLQLMAHWADRVADAYRPSGALWDASKFYAMALNHVSAALKDNPGEPKLRFQQAQTRFGQIMVDAYLIRGAYEEAYKRHEQLLKEVDAFLEDLPDNALKADIASRRIHIVRQQAEMLRCLGHYAKGLTLIRKVIATYPKSSYEPRCYSRMSEADFLRLLGKTGDALTRYNELEKYARPEYRNLPGLLGAVLWRKSGALQCIKDEKNHAICLRDLERLAEKFKQRYQFVAIYSSLVKASGKVTDVTKGLDVLREVETTYKLRSDYLVTEYAHLCLCRGELFRAAGKTGAHDWFQKASKCYSKTECRWGMVRAGVGICLSGGKTVFPIELRRSLEGLDAKLVASFEAGREISPGSLSMNIP